jgi:NodT family efflux transporter outer membrane factor (OMF) lipoprotein
MKRMKSVIVLCAVLVTGCAVGPNYKEPQVQVPDQYGQPPATQPATQPTTQPIAAAWWTNFNDPTLNQLIDDARRSNLDLRTAEARVREARAARGIISADYWPDIDATGSYSRSRASKTIGNFGQFAAGEQDLWQAGFDAAWEIDVFGRVRRGVQAADADIQAAVADRNDVLLSLLGEVARNYVELRGFQRQVAIAENNVKSQQETLELTRVRLNAGLGTDLAVAQTEAIVAATQSQIPAFQTLAQQAIHRLSVLTGKPPAALVAELDPIKPVPAPPPDIPAGVPSELLRRRPDIRRAERQLAAATARVGVATADLFPRFTLTGSLGVESNEFDNLGDNDSIFWSIGPGVRFPIFNRGRLKSAVAVENARTEQALSQYEQTVLRSLEEVENALVAYRKEFVRRESLARAVASSQRSVQLSQQLYQRGLTDFLNVLDAQRALYQNQDLLVQSESNVSANAVALFKALGGGWDVDQRVAARE